MNKAKKPFPLWAKILTKSVLTAGVLVTSYIISTVFILFLWLYHPEVHKIFFFLLFLLLPGLIIPQIWVKRRERPLIIWGICAVLLFTGIVINVGVVAYVDAYNASLIIDTAPNIQTHEYLPFKEDSKIVTLDQEASLQFSDTDALPILDGAAAVFPVYSAFVNAVYPESVITEYLPDLTDGPFRYNNTVVGYQKLAERETDIFFGAYPSKEQIAYAEENGTQFVYTPIGTEAFVFFIHTDNPIDSLTSEQIRAIYSGEITNWKDVGGQNEEIAAFQRNEGSGSQSMLIRFMGDTPIMKPPVELVDTFMSGIIEEVADYKSTTAAIGFSYRYYMEGIIQNPNVKLLAVDGIAPTPENIQNGSYPITAPLYAVTYAGNENENVERLLTWILSAEGQTILTKTGYSGAPHS